MRLSFTLAAAAFAAAGASAQIATPDPDWREQDVPPPPALQAQGLVEIEIGTGPSELRFGIDPKSVSVGRDRVVRYVMVATSRSGAVNASYEGLRCDRGEYRVYARSSGQGWRPVATEWRSLFDGVEARRALAVARGGACQGRSANDSTAQILRDLATPPGQKFGGWSTR
jgi:hypothetical protein